ncbi:HAD family hydrolase [Streptomyces sp. NA02950]|uniref:HAD family hydrolase n=1 Tax=Streptomyces sp. NA02950 TaxID=2742137 RepID=UPI0026E07ED9|nr:HAD hydrolase-like protein [Streptomyces sp. NA02950]
MRTALERACVFADRAVLVGDTPADVRGGLAGGVRVVAVATGRSSTEDLREAGAEVVVDDLSDTRQVLKLLTS